MKLVWAMIGVGIAAAAGGALWLSGSAPVEEAQTETPVATTQTSRGTQPRQSRVDSLVPGLEIQDSSGGRSVFAGGSSARTGASPGKRSGETRAERPSRVPDEGQGPLIEKRNAAPLAAAKPTTTPAKATTTTTGSTQVATQVVHAPPAAAQGQTQSAAMEQRRQQIEAARRQRQTDADRRRQGGIATPTQQASSDNGSESDSSDNDGIPSLEDIIRDNPWLADYAPGGSKANGNTGSSSSGNSNSNSGSNSGNSGSSGNNGSSGNSGSGSGPTTTNGTPSGGGGGPAVLPTSATHRWISVDNRACGSVAGFRTNDLYVRLPSTAPVLSIDLSGDAGFALAGGVFRQSTTGRADLPTSAATTDPCLQFDTYLNAGTAFTILPGNLDSQAFPGNNDIDASLFNFTGATPVQNQTLFGDTGFYILVGRFTASTTLTGFSGTLEVGVGGTGANFRTLVVNVPFDAAIWSFNASFGRPGVVTPPPDDDDDDDNSGGGPGDDGSPGDDDGSPGDDDNDGGDNGEDPVDPCLGQPAGLTAVWLAVNNNGCEEPDNNVDLGTFRTADLFLRMPKDVTVSDTTPTFRLQYVSAGNLGTVTPLVVSAGQFFQHPSGDVFKPFNTDVQNEPCLAFDSYVALDTGVTERLSEGTDTSVPAAVLPVTFTNGQVNGLWVVPEIAASAAVPAIAEPVRFPADPCGRYVRISRLTLSSGSSTSGLVSASIVLPGSSTPTIVQVTVPNCPSCWGQPATP